MQYTKIPTGNLSREEWLRLRKTGIGGSEAGAICGLNPWSSALTVYQDKISEELCLEDNEAMRQGRDLEDYVARRFMEAAGLKVRRSNAMYRNIQYPFMLADVDRNVAGEETGLECKTASAFSADEWRDGRIPPHYYIQCLHYMAVTGKKAWYIAVAILGREFKYARIEREERMIQNLIAIEAEFWRNHVLPKIPPEPDGSEASEEMIKRYFPRAKKTRILLPETFDSGLKRREEILKTIARLEQEQKQIEQKVKLFMGDYTVASNENYQVSWSNTDTARFDSTRFKEENPELYQKFIKAGSYRRFSVKAA